MEDCAPSIFLKNWALVPLYLCSRFCIFDRPDLEKYVYQVEGSPHLLRSCICAQQDGFPSPTRDMHPSFESLVTGTSSLQVSLMNFHHDTSLRSISEDDSISS